MRSRRLEIEILEQRIKNLKSSLEYATSDRDRLQEQVEDLRANLPLNTYEMETAGGSFRKYRAHFFATQDNMTGKEKVLEFWRWLPGGLRERVAHFPEGQWVRVEVLGE